MNKQECDELVKNTKMKDIESAFFDIIKKLKEKHFDVKVKTVSEYEKELVYCGYAMAKNETAKTVTTDNVETEVKSSVNIKKSGDIIDALLSLAGGDAKDFMKFKENSSKIIGNNIPFFPRISDFEE